MVEASLVLFLTASLVVIVAPGPDNILVLTRGVAQGRGAALVSAVGASLGLVVHSVFAAAGLSALLAQSALAFSVVKYVGAAFLIYLGVRALVDREGFALTRREAPMGLGKVFAQAVASNVLNPKIAVFFLAYLPQFADDPATGRTAIQLLAFGLTFALLTLAVFSALAVFSGTIGSWLRSRPKLAGGLGWLTGAVLISLGLRLAFQDRR